MLDSHFAILAALINLVGAAGYAVDTLRGRARPNRVSWMLWAVAPLIGFAAELRGGVGLVSAMTLALGLGPVMVVIASFIGRNAYYRLGPFDLACGVCALVALALWVITREGTLAVALSIAADLLAGVPTLVKAYREPHTEVCWPFLTGVAGATLTLLTVQHWSLSSAGFPIYIVLITGTLSLLIGLPNLRPSRRQAEAATTPASSGPESWSDQVAETDTPE
ncbi:MAG TPA: hypothetical protein VIA06_24250 [Candidatus Dormibacteraeota bacterium]|nr:hypothetical protein [Candidatus Dormibacteraeota bacterium]